MKRIKKIRRESKKKQVLLKILKIVWWVSLLVIGFIGNDLWDIYTAKPSVDIKTSEDFYEKGLFEFTLVNGDVDLEDIKVSVQSSVMKSSWKPYFIDHLPKNSEYAFDFYEDETSEVARKINCRNNPFDNLDHGRARVSVYRNVTSEEIIIPYQNVTFYSCQLTNWKLRLSSDKLNKTFYKQIYMPSGFIIEALGETDQSVLNSTDIIDNGELIMSLYDERAVEFSAEMS